MEILLWTLAQIGEIPFIKDITFWHLLATTSCGIVIKMISKHMQKTEETLQKVTEILNSVVTKNEVQEVRIEQHERRIERLEGNL